MPKIPDTQHDTGRKIFEWYESKKDEHREHLGASLIGHACDRYLWMKFRWVASPLLGGRIRRLFDTGKREEARVFEELRAIGVELHTESDGGQIVCRDASGHFGGSIDGVGLGFPEGPKTWAILEIKTSNAKSFAAFKTKKVAEAKPQHYAQMMVYAGLMKMTRALYVAVNKDTDELYTEWVHFESGPYLKLLDRARQTVSRSTPADKISDDPTNWQCKMCDLHPVCHKKAPAEVNCRTCCHSTPVAKGKWHCSMFGKPLSVEDQHAACDSHLFIPNLVHATPIDGGENYIQYKVYGPSRNTFINGPSHIVSKNLAKASKSKPTGPPIADFNDDIPF